VLAVRSSLFLAHLVMIARKSPDYRKTEEYGP
jgi:hypothetical protein